MLAFFKDLGHSVLSFRDFHTILVAKFIRCQIGTSLAVQMFIAVENG